VSARFETVTIIGVGLLGSSLGLAMKARSLAGTIRGVGHRQESLDKALAVGAVDEVAFDAREASREAALVVICTPAALVPPMLDEIRPVCAADTIVTDVASTKAAIANHARETWPAPLRVVASHPMAGSEKFGPEYGRPDFYEGTVTIVEPLTTHAPDAHAAVCALWQAVGSTLVEIPPPTHDALLARTSHIPHVVAACLSVLADRLGDVRAVAGKGFSDVTRVAAGRPELWRDICLTNDHAIAEGLGELIAGLDTVRRHISDGAGDELAQFFDAAARARARVVRE
jgi:prephenate dehydrogenase